ncbi:MAG: transketolase [Bacteroidales bacterium]|uniref:transketolase family protein n=1 Tax=Porphyromonas sp. TaxID=1924944 RepID=UPI0029766700|nr:transketolase [Porphyromonas sp.]MDD7437569.1 transketolase [Bacteroidales bacterium]MDY3067258.1 transketolase [Porphyromonas sp.]
MATENTLSLKAADNLRILSLSMVERAKSGHPGGAMGGADFAHILFSEYMVYDPERPEWIARDRFFLDPGHMSPMLYGVLAMTERYTMEELMNFRQWGSPTPGHPELDVVRGIENTSGPLGLGHTMAVGAAIAAKKIAARFGEELMRQRIFAFISDGGVQEEVSQGAGRIAGHLGLDNLIMFYDANDVQLSTKVSEVMTEDVAMKYRAWNWEVIEIDGNNHDQIRKALDQAIAVKGKPTLIIGRTIMGKGMLSPENECFEGLVKTHGQPLSAAGGGVAETIKSLGGNPEEPFVIFDEVQALYRARKEEIRREVAKWQTLFAEWSKSHADDARELERWISLDTSLLDWKSVEQKPNDATRNASAKALGFLAKNIPNMIVASADLSNSDKTDGFLKETKMITKDDFTGAFLQPGVSELTMAAVCIGIALHGGFHTACGTFFVFSDYMKPAVRIAALMEVPVRFVWTHDAFRVGEDGPTHEPVEQEAQIRLMEKLKNHSGNPSTMVLRPADVYETTVSWQMAMENKSTPTVLILSRQNVDDLPGNDYIQSLRVKQGGYLVQKGNAPDAILVATGSEVSTLVAGAKLLEEEGIKCNIASITSEAIFRQQTETYQAEVLPDGLPRFGLTAGLPVNLEGLIPHGTGKIWGLESFGFSAPYKVLDEKLGFTPENVKNQVKQLLNK